MDFIVFNYSRLPDTKIECYINNFILCLHEQGINIDFKILFAEENDKDRFKKFIEDMAFIDAIFDEMNIFIGEKTNFEDTQNHKVIFIGQQLKTRDPINLWGEAQYKGPVAVIKKLEEKAIWHEIAHLIGADDHYTVTHEPTKKCKDPENCIMTYGKLTGGLCSESINEIINHMKFVKCS